MKLKRLGREKYQQGTGVVDYGILTFDHAAELPVRILQKDSTIRTEVYNGIEWITIKAKDI